MKLSSTQLAASALALAFTPSALAFDLTWQRYASGVLENAFYGGSYGFPIWAQGAEKVLIPLFKEIKTHQVTLVMPGTESFNDILEARGGNWSNPRSGMTAEFKVFWCDVMPYFFVKNQFNASLVPDGTSFLLDSYKVSPAGDWPLQHVYRRDVDAVAADPSYNGSMFYEPYGSGNISIPTYPINNDVSGFVFDFWPNEPQSLSATVAAAGVSNWAELTARVPAAAALDTQRNFTLLLPPTASIAAALAKSDADLGAFVNAHLVPNERIILGTVDQAFTTQAGGALTISSAGAAVGALNATMAIRDVLSNGGILQVLSGALSA